MSTVAERVAGVCIVRDALDLIPFLCGHYLRIGFGHVAFIDDGSSDGTFEFLSTLARRTPRVSVKRVVDDQFRQSIQMTDRTNELIAAGYSIIVPFDADEFWFLQARELEVMLAAWTDTAFCGRWVNFVQRRTRLHSQPLGLLGMTYRAPELADAGRASVTGFTRPFVCVGTTKIAFKTTRPVALTLGQHALKNGPERHFQHNFEIFHAPIRARSEIEKRGLNYEPRRASIRKAPEGNWQSKYHRDIVLLGKMDAEWAANSVDKSGRLDVHGTPLDLTRDRRLQYLLVLAMIYFIAHFRTWRGESDRLS